MSNKEQNDIWRAHTRKLIQEGGLTVRPEPENRRARLEGCVCPFPSQEPEHHATNCRHYVGPGGEP